MSQLALVTGSTAGIGYAIASRLFSKGFDVIITGRTEARVREAIESIGKAHPQSKAKLIGHAVDLTSATQIQNLLAKIYEVDVLVNNFGIFEPKAFAEISDEEWDKLWNANVMSGVRLARHYFPTMLKKNKGRVIFISSESGVQIPPEMIHYGVSKSAQIAVARGMAETAVGTAVTVNSVLVGPTKSEGVGEFLKNLASQGHTTEAEVEKNFFKEMRPTSLVKRFLKPEEIANFVAFLASDEASAMTGSAYRVDGGLLKTMI